MNLNSKQPHLRPRHRGSCRAVGLCLFLLIALRLLAEPYNLLPGHPDGVALVAPPPVPGSAEEAADLASARALFRARTAAEQARAFQDASLSIFLFAPAIGPFFQPGKFPTTEALFQKVKKDITEPLARTKDHCKRRRPYELDEQLALGRPEKSFGYPSGHSTRGFTRAASSTSRHAKGIPCQLPLPLSGNAAAVPLDPTLRLIA